MTIRKVEVEDNVFSDMEIKLFNINGHWAICADDVNSAYEEMKPVIENCDLGAIQAIRITITVMGRYKDGI